MAATGSCGLTDKETCSDFTSYDPGKKQEAAAEIYEDDLSEPGTGTALIDQHVAAVEAYCAENPDDELDELVPTGF